jgi:hypothetical protein
MISKMIRKIPFLGLDFFRRPNFLSNFIIHSLINYEYKNLTYNIEVLVVKSRKSFRLNIKS